MLLFCIQKMPGTVQFWVQGSGMCLSAGVDVYMGKIRVSPAKQTFTRILPCTCCSLMHPNVVRFGMGMKSVSWSQCYSKSRKAQNKMVGKGHSLFFYQKPTLLYRCELFWWPAMICLSVDPAFAVDFSKHSHYALEDWQQTHKIKNAMAIKSYLNQSCCTPQPHGQSLTLPLNLQWHCKVN